MFSDHKDNDKQPEINKNSFEFHSLMSVEEENEFFRLASEGGNNQTLASSSSTVVDLLPQDNNSNLVQDEKKSDQNSHKRKAKKSSSRPVKKKYKYYLPKPPPDLIAKKKTTISVYRYTAENGEQMALLYVQGKGEVHESMQIYRKAGAERWWAKTVADKMFSGKKSDSVCKAAVGPIVKIYDVKFYNNNKNKDKIFYPKIPSLDQCLELPDYVKKFLNENYINPFACVRAHPKKINNTKTKTLPKNEAQPHLPVKKETAEGEKQMPETFPANDTQVEQKSSLALVTPSYNAVPSSVSCPMNVIWELRRSLFSPQIQAILIGLPPQMMLNYVDHTTAIFNILSGTSQPTVNSGVTMFGLFPNNNSQIMQTNTVSSNPLIIPMSKMYNESAELKTINKISNGSVN